MNIQSKMKARTNASQGKDTSSKNGAKRDEFVKRVIVGTGPAHDSALRHVTGSAKYIDDLPDLPSTMHAALVTSNVAHGSIRKIDATDALALPGVHSVITANDVPHNDIAPILSNEPIFADKIVQHVGQIVAAVSAVDFATALQASRLVKVEIDERKPVFDVDEAHRRKQYVQKAQNLNDGHAKAAMKKADHTFSGTVEVGGQDHFYLEGHIALAIPGEDDEMLLWSSTQHPTEVQQHVAHALGLPANKIDCQVRRMGGGFGGKESQPTIIAAIAALFARRHQQPCKLRLRRHDDMAATGKRHSFRFHWQVGVENSGRIRSLDVDALANAGHVADLSGPVIARALTHLDNAYHIPASDLRGYACKTNTVSNTAFRGFGGPQGIVAIETVIDTVSRELGIEPNAMRAINYYGPKTGTKTPYDQRVEDNRILQVTDRVLKQAKWDRRRREINAYNKQEPVIRRGLAMMPVKFGISFNLTALNQAGALVHVYKDGSIHLNHGGTEMGQGLFVKVAQVVADVFGVRLEDIAITPTTTGKVPNTSATAASTGSDVNGWAAYNAAMEIRQRMTEQAASMLGGKPESIVFENGFVRIGTSKNKRTKKIAFSELAQQCWFNRISLSATGFYATPKLHWNSATMKGRPFFYYTWGAAVAEVAVDTMTGETRCLRADIVQDCGTPINPEIDLGQIEGAFVQGMGWLTCEELWWDKKGALRTVGPSTYKIPGSRDVPPQFNVTVLDSKPNVEKTIFHSKAIGEPPLMLSTSVWLAIRDAISSFSDGKLAANLDAPATPERVLLSIEEMKKRCRVNEC